MRFTVVLAVLSTALVSACASGDDPGGAQAVQLADDLVTQGVAAGETDGAATSTPVDPTSALRQTNVSDDSVDGSAGAGASAPATNSPTSTDVPGAADSTGSAASPPATSGSAVDDDREMGPGVTADEILVGFHDIEVAAAAQSLGANVAVANEGPIGDALVAWVNATGGIAGRRVVAVHHEAEGTSGTWASQAQAACSTFTEDNQVFVAIGSTVGGDDSLLACLADKSTPLIDSAIYPYDQQYYDEHRGLLYKPGGMVADRWVRAYADGLQKIGFFEGATVGLVTYDRPVTVRLSDNVLKPRLQQLGIEVVEQVVSPPGSVAGMGNTGSQMSSAILRFRAAGVDRVLFLENGGTAPFLFFNEAEAQGYRPLYALSSNDVPNSQAGNAGPEQLTGAVAIGWTPPNDTYNQPGGNASYDLCNQILEEAGVAEADYYSQPRCDAVFLLRAALERAPALTTAGLLAGVESLGGTYESPFTIGSSLRPGKHWGADLVQPLAYDLECECFNYTHSAYPPS